MFYSNEHILITKTYFSLFHFTITRPAASEEVPELGIQQSIHFAADLTLSSLRKAATPGQPNSE